MRVYHERLRVPFSWWLAGLFTVLVFGSIVWGGFSLLVGAEVYGMLLVGLAALLLSFGGVSIRVSDGVLTAGKLRVALADVGEVRALDARQARAMAGPNADPTAAILLRPYLHEAVYVAAGPGEEDPPYWLIGTRHAAKLADAIEGSRATAPVARENTMG